MSVRNRFFSASILVLALAAIVAYAEGPQLVIGCPKGATIPVVASVTSPVTGGETTPFTVVLSGTVTGQDQVVAMETDHPEVFSNFPETVVVPVGYDRVTFDLQTVQVSGQVQATITASCNGGQAQTTLTVNP